MNTILKTQEENPVPIETDIVEEVWTEEDEQALEAALLVIEQAQKRIAEREAQIIENNKKIEEIKKRLEEIEAEKEGKILEKKENNEGSSAVEKIKRILKISTLTALLTVSTTDSKLPENNNANKNDLKKNEITAKKEISLGANVSTIFMNDAETFNKRFNKETYESLPEYGKEIYIYMAENNPTPGRSYGFIDKDNALEYVFDKDNTLVAKIVVGYGEMLGDAPNTSSEFKKGARTTPPGVFLLSSLSTPEDIAEYGPNQYSLFGFSIRKDKVTLGEHETYPKEFEERTKKLQSPTPEDNNFSDGCINASPEDFKILKKNFVGDCGELLFVLPDKVTRENINKGKTKFEVKELMAMITPTMKDMVEKTNEIYSQRVNITITQMENLQKELLRLKIKIDKQNAEYQKDRRNVSKQNQIVRTKQEIKEAINKLGSLRTVLTLAYKKIEDLRARKVVLAKIMEKLEKDLKNLT